MMAEEKKVVQKTCVFVTEVGDEDSQIT